MLRKTSVVSVSVFLIFTVFMTIDFSPSTEYELNNDLEVKYTVSDGPELSSLDGIPGYPVTITAEVTGFSSGDIWSDSYNVFGHIEHDFTRLTEEWVVYRESSYWRCHFIYHYRCVV